MVDGYTKLFSSIIHSTVWQEPPPVKIVWVTLLAMSDQFGEVKASIPGLAKAAGVDIPQCEEALHKFQSPDPYSRTKDNEGRRIEECDGGWVLLNHAKYRHMQSQEDQRTKNAERQRRFREKSQALRNVTHNEMSRMSRQAEEEEKEISTPLPPTGEVTAKAKRTRKTKAEIQLEYPDGVHSVVSHCHAKWHKQQPDGAPINPDWSRLRGNVAGILEANTAITPEVLCLAVDMYLAKPKQKFKAPQYFFGPGDAENPTPYLAYARDAYAKLHPKVINA